VLRASGYVYNYASLIHSCQVSVYLAPIEVYKVITLHCLVPCHILLPHYLIVYLRSKYMNVSEALLW
jgi:hypothetical protein